MCCKSVVSATQRPVAEARIVFQSIRRQGLSAIVDNSCSRVDERLDRLFPSTSAVCATISRKGFEHEHAQLCTPMTMLQEHMTEARKNTSSGRQSFLCILCFVW